MEKADDDIAKQDLVADRLIREIFEKSQAYGVPAFAWCRLITILAADVRAVGPGHLAASRGLHAASDVDRLRKLVADPALLVLSSQAECQMGNVGSNELSYRSKWWLNRGKTMRVAYVTTYDPSDRNNWSGLGHAIMEAISDKEVEVEALGPLQTNYEMLGRIKRKFYRILFRLGYEYEREGLPGRGYARQVSNKLNLKDYDIVFSPGSIPISRLQSHQPIVIWADATFASFISHYGLSQSLCGETVRAGHATERLAYNRASLLIFASEWAARSAVKDYGIDKKKVRVVPFGANFISPPSRHTVLDSIDRRSSNRCQLITIGVDWRRKGMPRTVALARLLNDRGLPTELTVVGCYPPRTYSVPSFVKLAGFVDKRTPEGESRISELLLSAHFHVLFSTAEAFGVVFAEANAHAVPNIASDIGGIGTAVANGAGGQRFNLDSSLEEVARLNAATTRAAMGSANWLQRKFVGVRGCMFDSAG